MRIHASLGSPNTLCGRKGANLDVREEREFFIRLSDDHWMGRFVCASCLKKAKNHEVPSEETHRDA